MSGWGPMRLMARRAWQAGWRSHLVLLLVVAVSVAVVVGVLTGAQRAESALIRLRTETHAADVAVFKEEGQRVEQLVADVRAADGVTSVGAIHEVFVRPAGSELFPDYNLLPIAPWPTPGGAAVDVPVIVSGRAPDPGVIDEVALSEGLATELKLQVGDTITLESMTDAWVDVAYNGGDPGPPDGPKVRVGIVGLARSPIDFGRWTGLIHLTPAFATRYDQAIRSYTLVEARLTKTMAARVLAGDVDLPGDEAQPSFFSGSAATQDGLRTISTALQLIAATTALAGLTSVGLIMLRLARLTLADRATLTAIGWTRFEMVRVAVIVLAPWALIGGALGVTFGVLGSPWASIGLARSVDPAGNHVVAQAAWVASAAAASMLVAMALVLLSAARSSKPGGPPSTSERSVPALRRPLAVVLGLRRAVFGAPERGGRASRAAVAAVMGAVAVAVAALLVGSSIQRLQHDPSLSGQGSVDQLVVDAGEDSDVYVRAMAALERDARAVDLVGFHVAFGIRAQGVPDLTALVYDVRRGSVPAAMLHGRLPTQPDEVAVGPATLDDMGLKVGDSVKLSTDAGHARFRIVGETLFPEGDFAHDSGVALTVGGAEFLGGVEATAIHQVAFQWGPGVDVAAADRSLERAGFKPFSTSQGLMPAVVSNLGQVRSLPGLLAAVVLLLGLVTASHAVSQTTRSRRRETGTLAALGMTPPTIAAAVEVQGITVAMVAALGGIPLGLAAGRAVWTQIAERANVVDRPVPAWTSTWWVVAAVVLGTMALSLLPAARSRRQDLAEALRAE